jgi:rhodanese-related sulfurtransferase
MSDQMTFQQKSLFQQGYQQYSPSELKQLEWGLRFTPLVCSVIAAYGLFTAQPGVLFAVSVLGIWAFLAPAAHPMDLLYNHGVRHITHAVALPENPFQRRLACLAAGLMNFTAAVLFILELPVAALAVGITLLLLQAIVITTHFCALSWIYEGLMRMFGKWTAPLSLAEAEALFAAGAKLIDVRSQSEYARDAIAGAINLPLEQLEQHIDDLRHDQCLLYCSSGTRSHIATKKLRKSGHGNIYDLGSRSRASTLLQAA